MKKVEKGEFGYLAYKKSRNMIKTIIAFAVVLVIFIIGFIIWKSKNNYLTMLAVVLVLPAAKFAVSYFVLIPHKNCDEELKSAIEERKSELNSVLVLWQQLSVITRYLPIQVLLKLTRTFSRQVLRSS
jgi:glucan phosphoethanolaminetransferase (alkaline phosphatase superfamily)